MSRCMRSRAWTWHVVAAFYRDDGFVGGRILRCVRLRVNFEQVKRRLRGSREPSRKISPSDRTAHARWTPRELDAFTRVNSTHEDSGEASRGGWTPADVSLSRKLRFPEARARAKGNPSSVKLASSFIVRMPFPLSSVARYSRAQTAAKQISVYAERSSRGRSSTRRCSSLPWQEIHGSRVRESGKRSASSPLFHSEASDAQQYAKTDTQMQLLPLRLQRTSTRVPVASLPAAYQASLSLHHKSRPFTLESRLLFRVSSFG
jgi:hypothetical protein